MSIYEINMANARADVDTLRVKQNSPVVEVFSALAAGNQPNVADSVKPAILLPRVRLTLSSGSLLNPSCWRP